MTGLVLVLSAFLLQAGGAPPSDIITIDGSKNPEMIPEWDAWTSEFHIIAASYRAGSTALVKVLDLTDAEGNALFNEAEAQSAREAACGKRVDQLRPLLGKVPDSEINRRQAEIQIECRWDTLHARDRLLDALRPEARLRVTQFVEEHKAGMQVTVPKAELAHYQKPQ